MSDIFQKDPNTYKLLTPGPLTTSLTVREAMLVDRCTWDDDYKTMTEDIRRRLLKLAHAGDDAPAVGGEIEAVRLVQIRPPPRIFARNGDDVFLLLKIFGRAAGVDCRLFQRNTPNIRVCQHKKLFVYLRTDFNNYSRKQNRAFALAHPYL